MTNNMLRSLVLYVVYMYVEYTRMNINEKPFGRFIRKTDLKSKCIPIIEGCGFPFNVSKIKY